MGGGARAADPSPWQRFFAGLGPWDTASEFTRFSFGALFFATVAPFVFSSALLSTLWEAVDRGFSGGVFLSGQEQTGFLLGRVVPWVNRLTHPINKRFVKNPVDSYMVNAVLLFGVVIPGLLLLCGLHTLRNGGRVSWLLCLAYHQFRLGPFVMNFGWVYALSHAPQVIALSTRPVWRPRPMARLRPHLRLRPLTCRRGAQPLQPSSLRRRHTLQPPPTAAATAAARHRRRRSQPLPAAAAAATAAATAASTHPAIAVGTPPPLPPPPLPPPPPPPPPPSPSVTCRWANPSPHRTPGTEKATRSLRRPACGGLPSTRRGRSATSSTIG